MKSNAALMLLVLLSVSACATSGPPDSYCDNAFPIPLQQDDQVSERTETLVIKHNEKGEKLCGWKPPG